MLYLEIQCSLDIAGIDEHGIPGCFSSGGDNPGLVIPDGKLRKGYYDVMKEAREQGWKYTRQYGWVCPVCQKVETEKNQGAGSA